MKRYRRVFRHAERALSVSGTVLVMRRNGAFRLTGKAFPWYGRGFLTIRKSLFHCLEEPFPDGMTDAMGRQESFC